MRLLGRVAVVVGLVVALALGVAAVSAGFGTPEGSTLSLMAVAILALLGWGWTVGRAFRKWSPGTLGMLVAAWALALVTLLLLADAIPPDLRHFGRPGTLGGWAPIIYSRMVVRAVRPLVFPALALVTAVSIMPMLHRGGARAMTLVVGLVPFVVGPGYFGWVLLLLGAMSVPGNLSAHFRELFPPRVGGSS